MLTPEELMKPRYKVIADYPGNQWKVGDILDRNWGWDGDDETGFKHSVSDFPHLFRFLYWYEKRSPVELPGFVRIKSIVYKVDRWHNEFGAIPFADSDSLLGQNKTFLSVEWHFYAKQSEPATEQDYITYIQPL